MTGMRFSVSVTPQAREVAVRRAILGVNGGSQVRLTSGQRRALELAARGWSSTAPAPARSA